MPEAEYDPADGTVGYLTFDEWDRFLRAWTTAVKHLPWWWVAGHVRGGDADELKRRSREHALPLPATWLAAHEITRLMNELNKWPELEDAAHDADGFWFLLELTRETETAAAKWPLSDRSHRVAYFRCQACQQLTLKYLPPNLRVPTNAPTVEVQRREGDVVRPLVVADVVVRCTDKACGAVMDHAMFEIAVKVIEQEQELRRGKRGLAAGGSGGGDDGPVGSDDPSLGGVGSGEAVASGADVVLLRAGSDPSGSGDGH